MAISVLYDWPVATAGSTTPAPASQQVPTLPDSTTPFNRVRGRIVGDGTATNVSVTHNFGLTAAMLARDYPTVGLEPQLNGNPTWWVTAKTANALQLNFSAAITNGSTAFVFDITRPVAVSR